MFLRSKNVLCFLHKSFLSNMSFPRWKGLTDWKGIDCYFCVMISCSFSSAAQKLHGVPDQRGPQSCLNGPCHSPPWILVIHTKLYLTLLSPHASPFPPLTLLDSPDTEVPPESQAVFFFFRIFLQCWFLVLAHGIILNNKKKTVLYQFSCFCWDLSSRTVKARHYFINLNFIFFFWCIWLRFVNPISLPLFPWFFVMICFICLCSALIFIIYFHLLT